MENFPMCYRNRKLLYFSHNQFLYYRLLGREKEPKKRKRKRKRKKKLWHMFHKTNYHIIKQLALFFCEAIVSTEILATELDASF